MDTPFPDIPDAWRPLLDGVDLAKLAERVEAAYAEGTVYPPRPALFTALKLTTPKAVKVVVVGQDPYHGPGQAHGLAFSVQSPTPPPPSLRNIFRELADDVGVPMPAHGDLSAWARQGVLLLNTALTVAAGAAGSHSRLGWSGFTDTLLAALAADELPKVFVLWGGPAQRKRTLVERAPHTVITAPHPSPLSAHRGFFGSRPFSSINRVLQAQGRTPVDWNL